MSNSQNVKIARELVRIAKRLMAAGNEEAYLVLDADGIVEDVSKSEFDSMFRGASRKASRRRCAGISKAVIHVSPDVNAVSDGSGNIFSNLYAGVVNALKTMRNRMTGPKQIQESIMMNENPGRAAENDTLGCTIRKVRGMYRDVDSKGNSRNFDEASYEVVIYGATEQEAERIARDLQRRFEQKAVIVEYEPDVNSNYYE